MRCPSCQRTFDDRRVEELACLDQLRTRVKSWQAEGILPADAATRVLELAARDRIALERGLGVRPTRPPATPQPAVPPTASGAPAAPSFPAAPPLRSRPAFSWTQLGTSLLSERTLHALLGLGAFLILASGVVISTLNPTGLGPLLHLAAVLTTTMLFYAAGYVVRQRLKLALTGVVLLAIGGAFIPLTIWTLGQEKLLDWEPAAIWLAASLLCLPIYLASHAVLRDRTFAALVALTGGSELLAALNWLMVPLEWGLAALVALAIGYLLLARRLRVGWPALSWALGWAAQLATPLLLALLLIGRFSPAVFQVFTGRSLGGLHEYAVGAACWLGVAFFAVAAHADFRRWYPYAAVVLVVVTFWLHLQQLQVDRDATPLAWVMLAAVLLGLAEVVIRRSGEARRPLRETVLGRGAWRSRFAAPLFSVGYGVGLLGLWLALERYRSAPAAAGLRLIEPPVILAFLAIVAICALSVVGRRTGVFLYPATWLFLIPFTATVGQAARHFGLPLAEHHLARLLVGLAIVYLALGRLVDRAGGHYAKPVYLAGYALLPIGMLLSALDRVASVEVVGASILVYATSAWLVHRGGHPSFVWLVERLFGDAGSDGFRAARALFVYLASWLFPIWLLLALSLWRPAPAVAHYGLALTLLAPLYVAIGRRIRRIRSEYRLPWYLAGYVLSAVGPLVATADPRLRVVALALSIGLYAASAVVARRAAWLYPVALLTPVLLWQALDHLVLFDRFYGLGLVLLGLAYGVIGLILDRRLTLSRSHALTLSPAARPFLFVGYALSALGLARLANQERELVVLGFLLGALHYGGSAAAFRERIFGYPLAASLAVANAVGMTLSPLDPRYYGLGLLPAVVVLLVGAEWLRERLDGASAPVDCRPLAGLLDTWSTPSRLAAYGLTVVMPWLLPDCEQGLRTALVYTLVFGLFAWRRGREADAWAALATTCLGYAELLGLLGVPSVEQPPRWAVAALLLTLGGLGLRRRPLGALQVWARPLYLGSLGLAGAALFWAIAAYPPSWRGAALQALAATCAISGLTLVAHALDRRERLLAYAGVALVEVGYLLQLVYFDVGQPQAFVLPAGLYLLAVAYVEWRLGTVGQVKGALEVGALSLLLGTSLFQAVGFLGAGHDRYVYATLLLIESVAIFGLGAVLHWRRTFFAGALALVADVAILLADPLRAMNTWYLVAVVGLAMIGLVIFVEQRRQQIPFWLDEWRQRLESWD